MCLGKRNPKMNDKRKRSLCVCVCERQIDEGRERKEENGHLLFVFGKKVSLKDN